MTIFEPSAAPAYSTRSWSLESDVAWRALDVSLLAPIIREALGLSYQHTLSAERLGLRAVERLLEVMPEGSLRDATRAQHSEELRHVAFFERFTQLLDVGPLPSAPLLGLEARLDELHDYRDLLVYLQVLENAAHAVFTGSGRQCLRMMQRLVRLPGTGVLQALMHVVTGLVGRDEARHVAFGMRVLRAQLAGASGRELHVTEELVQATAALMQAMLAEVEGSFRVLGFERGEVAARVANTQRRYFSHLGFASEAGASAYAAPAAGAP